MLFEDIDSNYLSNVRNIKSAEVVSQNKSPLSLKVDDKPLSQITKNLTNKIKHETLTSQKSQILKIY